MAAQYGSAEAPKVIDQLKRGLLREASSRRELSADI